MLGSVPSAHILHVQVSIREQKQHMFSWLRGEHMIRSVLFSDWTFKLRALSLDALCLHLAMLCLVAVFCEQAGFQEQNRKLCAGFDLQSYLFASIYLLLL